MTARDRLDAAVECLEADYPRGDARATAYALTGILEAIVEIRDEEHRLDEALERESALDAALGRVLGIADHLEASRTDSRDDQLVEELRAAATPPPRPYPVPPATRRHLVELVEWIDTLDPADAPEVVDAAGLVDRYLARGDQ